MTAGLADRPTWQRAALWLGVLCLHLVLIALLAQPVRPRDAAARRTEVRVTMHLLPSISRPPAASTTTKPVTSLQRTTPARGPRVAEPRQGPVTPEAITLGREQASPVPEPAASQPLRPLDLTVHTLPRPPFDARSEALDDPRGNSRGKTPEARMAKTLGEDKLAEENIGDGRRRFRRNGDCLESRPSRASQLDPYANVPRPNLIGACY